MHVCGEDAAGISAIEPVAYMRRFLRFMERIVDTPNYEYVHAHHPHPHPPAPGPLEPLELLELLEAVGAPAVPAGDAGDAGDAGEGRDGPGAALGAARVRVAGLEALLAEARALLRLQESSNRPTNCWHRC